MAGPTPPVADGNATSLLRISSTTGDVFIQPAATNDLAVPLMLGTAQGGLEVSRYAAAWPAPNGITFKASARSSGSLAGRRTPSIPSRWEETRSP